MEKTYENIFPEWSKKILELTNPKESSNYYSLNDLAFEKIKECKANFNGTITFDKIYSKICTHFSIKKTECRKLLKYFESIGRIEFIPFKGIKIIHKNDL